MSVLWQDNIDQMCAAVKQPAITRVCKVLREELLPYYYRTQIDLTADGGIEDWRLVESWTWTIDKVNRASVGGVICRPSWSASRDLFPRRWIMNFARFKVNFVEEMREAGVKCWNKGQLR